MDIEHAEHSTTSRGDGRIFTRGKIREHRTGGGSLLGELAPRTKLVAGGKYPNSNWGLMDKETARSYSEAWMREPMMKPRKVV